MLCVVMLDTRMITLFKDLLCFFLHSMFLNWFQPNPSHQLIAILKNRFQSLVWYIKPNAGQRQSQTGHSQNKVAKKHAAHMHISIECME